MKFPYRLASILSLILVMGLTESCKKSGPNATAYITAIQDMAAKYQAECPKNLPNGTQLESVIFTLGDSTLTYKYSMSDKAIVSVNVNDSNFRKNIIEKLPNQLKEYLVKGKCKLKYKYVSPHDSSYIEIIPQELERTLQVSK